MDNDWKDWDVVENVRSPMIPGFMIPYDGTPLDSKGAAGKRMREEWDSFVDLLNAEGPGTGYQRLLALRENMEARQDELRKKLEKWEDRESWLQKLEGQYIAKLLVVAGVEHQSVWRGRENPIEQLDLDDSQVADEPIVEAFLEFDEDGGLEGRPDLESGWMLRVDGLFQGAESDGSRLFQVPEFGLEDERLRRDNIMIRFGFSTEELQNLGIDPENLPTSRQAIQMDPSTTWREALDQLKDKEQSVREKKGRPERTLQVLEFRLGILEDVLYRFEAFGSIERLTEEEAQEAAREAIEDKSTPEGWEKNAAMMHAYFSNHTTPEYISKVDEAMEEAGGLDSFSYEHAWKKLRKEGWATSKGKIQALEDALEEWALEFEEKYGASKAVDAAKPFEWPFQKDV
jgi:hypothetical protein